MNQTSVRAKDNHQIFLDWMTDHRGIVVKIVRSFTTDPTDVEDLTQDIGLALWRSIPSFRGESKASTWIWRIAINQAVSWQRRKPEREVELDSVAEPAAKNRSDDSFSVDRIYEAIRTLAPIDRSLIVLSLEGHRYTEIADITGLTETNVGARLSRARRQLSELLEGVA